MNKDVHIFKRNEYIALYNSLTMDIAFMHNKDFVNDRVSSDIEKLLPKEISSNNDYWKEIMDRLDNKLEPDITTMYMFLNENCNMYCTYCRYMQKLPINFNGKVMDIEHGKKQISKFLEWNKEKRKKKTIVFFGTEVLINIDILKELILYTKILEERYELEKTELVIFTNGLLLNEEIIRFLKENHVVPIVSIDGWKELHDKARITRSGKGTFDIIQRNCKLMNNSDLKFGISLAVGEHNIDFLPEIVEYFVNNFSPINIGMNPMEINDRHKREVFFEKYIKQGIEAYKIGRELKISIPQIMRRIRPFVEKKHRIKECPTCGGAIRIYPTGKIGTCSHFVAVNEHCMNEKEFLSMDFQENEVIKTWSSRTQFRFKECRNCEAISLCGGGCVYNAWLQNGSIMSPDYRICTHSKIALEWCVWELFMVANGQEIIKKDRIFIPSAEDRRKIYGKLDEKAMYLPLQNYNTYGELELI